MDYNARYYSPYLGRFVSPDTVVPDPAAPISFNRYAYSHNNPVKYRDPSGHIIETIWDVANIVIGLGSLSYNLSQGNYTDAAIDTGGLVLDVAATAIPGVPGGASAAIKAARTADKVGDLMDVAKAANGASNIVQGANQIENGLGAAKQAENLVDASKAANSAYELARSENYRGTFFANNPALRKFSNDIIVHHRIPLEVLKKRPNLFSVDELNAAGNLTGIPKNLNQDLHLSEIHGNSWNKFWRDNPNATREQIEQFAKSLDEKFNLDNLAKDEFLK